MNVLWKRHLWLGFWTICIVFISASSGVVLFMAPAVNALEDYETALWAATTAGRFSIARDSAFQSFFIALFPSLFLFWANKNLMARDETMARLNPKRTAITVWATMSACGVAGALAFWFRVHP